MQMNYRWLMLIMALSLTCGCATYESWPGGSRSKNDQPPAEVVRQAPADQTGVVQPTQPETAGIPDPQPDVIAEVAKPTGPAGFLLEEAETKRAMGDLAGAALSIERAMRIQAGNPWLSLRLAAIRLEQGNSSQSELLAQRALAQAGGDRQLQKQCWSMTAAARRAAGNTKGAAAALAKASD